MNKIGLKLRSGLVACIIAVVVLFAMSRAAEATLTFSWNTNNKIVDVGEVVSMSGKVTYIGTATIQLLKIQPLSLEPGDLIGTGNPYSFSLGPTVFPSGSFLGTGDSFVFDFGTLNILDLNPTPKTYQSGQSDIFIEYSQIGDNDILSNLDPYVVTIKATGTGAPIPEPSTMLLLGSGLAGLGFFRRRRKAA